MLIENKNIEKTCSFYVSDFHLEMILLPYINKKIEENEEVIIQSERDLTDSINVVISKINLTNEKKAKILSLGWKGSNVDIKEKSNVVIIGSKKYIDEKNMQIKNTGFNKLNVLDCYNFDEIKDEIYNIKQQYDNTLNCLGNNNF